MENRELINKYPFRIVDVKTNSYQEGSISDDKTNEFNKDLIEFKIQASVGFSKDKKLVQVNFSISYEYEESQLLNINTDTVFAFDDIEGLDLENKILWATLMGISFSTIRGIIINRTRGSFLDKIYLPIINPTEIIEDMYK